MKVWLWFRRLSFAWAKTLTPVLNTLVFVVWPLQVVIVTKPLRPVLVRGIRCAVSIFQCAVPSLRHPRPILRSLLDTTNSMWLTDVRVCGCAIPGATENIRVVTNSVTATAVKIFIPTVHVSLRLWVQSVFPDTPAYRVEVGPIEFCA